MTMTRYADASEWPEVYDADIWTISGIDDEPHPTADDEPAPSDADLAWWMEECRDDEPAAGSDDDDMDDAVPPDIDDIAAEAIFHAAYERGIRML
jgi:hypothetical protein